MNPPAYGTRNGQKGVLGTGESLLGPTPGGWEAMPVYNRLPREVAWSPRGSRRGS